MNGMKRLPRNFYTRETLIVARELLGKCLVRRTQNGDIVSNIVEVEGYRGLDDPASHAYKGLTKRNWPMFEQAGLAYVYFIYGNHYCLNVTTGKRGVPGAVLIRAVEIIDGLELARKNREVKSLVDLSNGPGKLTKALNITRLHNGLDLTRSNELFLSKPEINQPFETVTSKRIGIKVAAEKPWRFYIKANKFVSRR